MLWGLYRWFLGAVDCILFLPIKLVRAILVYYRTIHMYNVVLTYYSHIGPYVRLFMQRVYNFIPSNTCASENFYA